MSESQAIVAVKAREDGQLQLLNKSSNKYLSGTTKSSISRTPKLQTSSIFQRLIPGIRNEGLQKLVRGKSEQLSFMEETKQNLLVKISRMRCKVQQIKQVKRKICRSLRLGLKDRFL